MEAKFNDESTITYTRPMTNDSENYDDKDIKTKFKFR